MFCWSFPFLDTPLFLFLTSLIASAGIAFVFRHFVIHYLLLCLHALSPARPLSPTPLAPESGVWRPNILASGLYMKSENDWHEHLEITSSYGETTTWKNLGKIIFMISTFLAMPYYVPLMVLARCVPWSFPSFSPSIAEYPNLARVHTIHPMQQRQVIVIWFTITKNYQVQILGVPPLLRLSSLIRLLWSQTKAENQWWRVNHHESGANFGDADHHEWYQKYGGVEGCAYIFPWKWIRKYDTVVQKGKYLTFLRQWLVVLEPVTYHSQSES